MSSTEAGDALVTQRYGSPQTASDATGHTRTADSLFRNPTENQTR